MARILFLAHRIPFPPNKGDKIRSWHFLEHLAKRHSIHLGFYVDNPKDIQHVAHLENLFDTVCWQYVGPVRQKLGMLWGLLSGKPLTTAAYPKQKLRAYVRRLMDAGEVDAVFLFSGAVAALVDMKSSKAPVVLDLVDVDSAKWAQYAPGAGFPMSWVYRREAHLLAVFEKAFADTADRTLFVSDDEAELFRSTVFKNGDPARIGYVNNGVDIAHFDPGRFDAAQENQIVIFTGAMDYHPNIEAAEWFVGHVWPLVLKENPQAIFVIAGAPVHPRVSALAGETVKVLGFVDDMAEEISRAAIVVAPLQTARGIQNKVLEGMAMAKAVIATPEAKEGIDAAEGEHLIVADGAEAFAGAVLSLLSEPPKAKTIGTAARAHMERHYHWDACLTELDRIFDTLVQEH